MNLAPYPRYLLLKDRLRLSPYYRREGWAVRSHLEACLWTRWATRMVAAGYEV